MSEQNIQSISSKIWAMANELRGNMDAAEFKNYILAFMFYRYLSEHQEDYLKTNQVIDIAEGQSVNDAYKEEASGDDLSDYIEDISSSLGYAINPDDTWASLLDKINNSEVIPSDYQTLFDNFNTNASLNQEASKDFKGVFNDLNLRRNLGTTHDGGKRTLDIVQNFINSLYFFFHQVAQHFVVSIEIVSDNSC